MPSDTGYDLTLYPNLARYRTPQRDINTTLTEESAYNVPDKDKNTYDYTAYNSNGNSLKVSNYPPQPTPLSQQSLQDEGEDQETLPTSSSTPLAPQASATTFIHLFTSDILLRGDEWRRHCPRCSGGGGGGGGRVCLARGRCVEDGGRVKVLFW